MYHTNQLFFLKVAHFYNTIDQQMIPSQQSIMLDTALAFEHIIKNPRAGARGPSSEGQITWDSPEELEGYIKKLQGAADKLTSENRRLRKCHGLLTDKASAGRVKGEGEGMVEE